MAILAHLSAPIAMVISAGWLSFVGPLLVWLLYKDRSAYVRESAAGAFNFNLGMSVMSIIGWLCILTFFGALIGVPLVIVASVMTLVVHIRAAMKTRDGVAYRYPLQIRVLS